MVRFLWGACGVVWLGTGSAAARPADSDDDAALTWHRKSRLPQQLEESPAVVVRGRIAKIDSVTAAGRQDSDLYFDVIADGDAVAVRVAPTWFVAAQAMRFSPGEAVEVVGTWSLEAGPRVLVAFSVQKDGATLTLRHVNGLPVWAVHSRRVN